MLKTEPEMYLVSGVRETHIWLQVLEGEDSGLRVSIPRYDRTYSDKMQKQVENLSEGDVKTFVLVSEDEDSPNWYPTMISERQR